MTQFLTALLFIAIGFLMAIIPAIYIHRRHKQAWQSEYRRLMGGIKSARDGLGSWVERRTGLKDQKDPVTIKKDLDKLLYNDPKWPRS